MSMQNLSISIWEAYPNLQKEKGIQKWTGIVVKSGKTWGTIQKDYHQIGGRTAKCHKSRITLWEKAILQPKKKSKVCRYQTISKHIQTRKFQIN